MTQEYLSKTDGVTPRRGQKPIKPNDVESAVEVIKVCSPIPVDELRERMCIASASYFDRLVKYLLGDKRISRAKIIGNSGISLQYRA